MKNYPNASICWAQEEHKNAGAYEFVKLRLESSLRALNDDRLSQIRNCYAGRPTSASTATGNKVKHYQELANLFKDAMAI